MAELLDAEVIRANFENNTNALGTATKHLGQIQTEARKVAVANTNIAECVSRLPQAPVIEVQAIRALI